MIFNQWVQQGNSLCEMGEYQEALEAYETALSLDIESAPLWNNKAFALYHLGRYQDALDACDIALSIDPNYGMAWNNKGDVLDIIGKYEEAIDCYDRALIINPDNKQILASKDRTQSALIKSKSIPELRTLLKVKNIMTQNPIILPSETPLKKIKEIFKKNKIWAVLIGNPEKYYGIITRKDLESRGRNKSVSTPVSEIMTKNPLTIDQEANVTDAIKILHDAHINGLAVLHDNKPCGIITRYDIKTRYDDDRIPFDKIPKEKASRKINWSEVIKTAKLLEKSLKAQEIDDSYYYATELLEITDGGINSLVTEIRSQLDIRIENNIFDIPDEIIRKAKFLSLKIEMSS